MFPDQAARLAFGEMVSAFLMDVVRNLPKTLGFLISKGGITSNDVLSSGLTLRTSRVVGQILPGCSVVCCPSDHPRYPHMPVVIFPGMLAMIKLLQRYMADWPAMEFNCIQSGSRYLAAIAGVRRLVPIYFDFPRLL